MFGGGAENRRFGGSFQNIIPMLTAKMIKATIEISPVA
jgi:hypothetical protein